MKAKRKPGTMYELYPLPFFERKSRCTWKVEPTGNYSEDHATGEAYAIQFLQSCDGSVGWSTLLSHIVGNMILAEPNADEHQRVNGIVIGFMRGIGEALCAQSRQPFAR